MSLLWQTRPFDPLLPKKRTPSNTTSCGWGWPFLPTGKLQCPVAIGAMHMDHKIRQLCQGPNQPDFLDNNTSNHSSVCLYNSEDKSFVGFWGYVVHYWHHVCIYTQHSKQQNNSHDSSWSDRRLNALFWCNHRYTNSLEASHRRPPGRNIF